MITANDLKRAEKLLRELPYMESALAYYDSLADAPISDRVRRALNGKQKNVQNSVTAVQRALSMLSPTERQVADELFFAEKPDIAELCEDCGLAKSSIYRHRRHILEKVVAAVWGKGL